METKQFHSPLAQFPVWLNLLNITGNIIPNIFIPERCGLAFQALSNISVIFYVE